MARRGGRDDRAPDLAVLIPDLAGGGAERATVAIVNALAARGLHVELVCGKAAGPNLAAVDDRVSVVDLGLRRFRWALVPVVRYVREARPANMMGILTQANLVATVAARLARWPGRLVVNERQTLSASVAAPSVWWQRLLPFFVRLAFRRADAVVTVSQGVADDLVTVAPMLAPRVTAIPNPVDVTAIARSGQGMSGHPWTDEPGHPVLLHVGRLARHKNVDVTLDAFAEVRAERPLHLLVLGDGPERAALEARVQRLGVEEDVDFLGYVDPPYPFMAKADVLVLASSYEGWPNVLVEALALGCPVVATDCPSGPAEILARGKFGPLVPVRDANGLAVGIRRALDAPPAASVLQERARSWSPNRIIDAYLEVLNVDQEPRAVDPPRGSLP